MSKPKDTDSCEIRDRVNNIKSNLEFQYQQMFKRKYFYYTENHHIDFQSSKKAHFYLDQLIILVNSYTNKRAKISDLLVQIQKPLREDKEFKKII